MHGRHEFLARATIMTTATIRTGDGKVLSVREVWIEFGSVPAAPRTVAVSAGDVIIRRVGLKEADAETLAASLRTDGEFDQWLHKIKPK